MNPADADPERTALAPSGAGRTCPFCGSVNPVDALRDSAYNCQSCGRPLAHVDYLANGCIRGIFGWLLSQDDVVLGRYRVKSVLGKGGFGAAYLVDDLQLSGKRWALKEVPEPLFDGHETSLLIRIKHPAIPVIADRQTVNGMVYQVLQFGGDRTLDHERKRHPDLRVPLAKLLPLMRQLCDVLIYLHSQTPPIIHRDLKPGNVLLDENDRIMLIDFDIAKEAAPEAMTRTLGRAATAHFSPPEQVMGTGTDERADIYALGATFYALLTGQNPPAAHERVSGKDLLPPSEFVPEVLPEVEDAILQALSLNMNHRQQTMREFALALGGTETGEVSRPIRTDATDRTVAVGSHTAGTMPPSVRTGGLRIPTAPTGRANTASTRGPASAPIAAPASPKRGLPVPLLAGGGIGLAGIAIGAFLFFGGKGSDTDNQNAANLPPSPAQAVVAPAVPGPQVTPNAATATPPPIPSQSAISPQPPTTPTPSTQPAPTGSAMDILQTNGIRSSEEKVIVEPPPKEVEKVTGTSKSDRGGRKKTGGTIVKQTRRPPPTKKEPIWEIHPGNSYQVR
ncbi:protein kinase domain-containing protein [Methylomagnum sp.]